MIIENYLEHEVRHWRGWLTQLRPYAWKSGNSLAIWSQGAPGSGVDSLFKE